MMRFNSRLDAPTPHHGRRYNRPPTTNRRRFAPRLDVFEDRTLLSTFTVTNLDDSGSGSLRQAILDANGHAGADTVQFQNGLSGTIALSASGGPLVITDPVDVQGPGADKLSVSGASDRFLNGTAYVARSNYYPLEIDTTGGGGERIVVQAYEYLPASTANLALVR